jgi:hypothetical protein
MAAIGQLGVAERQAVLTACDPQWSIFAEMQRIRHARRMTGIEDSLPPLPIENYSTKRKRCPCCHQLADPQVIAKARQSQTGPGEEPEQAYRRGYHHGAFIVAEAIKGRVPPALQQPVDAFVAAVGNWRLEWRCRNRRRSWGLENYRFHSAPKPCWLHTSLRCFEGDLPKPLDQPGQAWGVVRYRMTTGGWLDKDCCSFNGWYPSHVLVQAIYADWCMRYPDYTVVLVTQDLARFMKRPSTVQVLSAGQQPPPVPAEVSAGAGDQKST